MKQPKISFDFSDRPELVNSLRAAAAATGKSQKEILSEALETHFAHLQETALLLGISKQTFAEWDNPEDKIYDEL